MARLKDNFLVVAAIDFGTTFSGYAYSTKDDYERNALEMYTNAQWTDPTGLCIPSIKCPTSILFDRDKKFDSFGYSAESNYMGKVEEDDHKGWRFFNKFKMSLYRKMEYLQDTLSGHDDTKDRLTRNIMLKDEQGEEMLAMTVFSEAIRYLKDHFINRIMDAWRGIGNKDVHWVLTVPAIWSDPAKQFMREAADMAGIEDDQLTIALEPEAATVFCKQIAIKEMKEENRRCLGRFAPGDKFMVIDMGGGTVDITCHRVQNDFRLKEIYRPSGGPWGGTMVDEAFISFLKELFGPDIWNSFVETNHSEKLDIERQYEIKKKSTLDGEFIHVPVGVGIMEYFEKVRKTKFETTLPKSRFYDTVKLVRGRLRIKTSIIEDMFKEPIDLTVEQIQLILAQRELGDVETIMLVGGFSESPIVKKKIQEAFPNLSVIHPVDCGLAVLKGAVLFGHSPASISERLSPKTYGFSTSVPRNPLKHPEQSRYQFKGKEMCAEVFKIMIYLGQPLIMGQTIVKHTCHPSNIDERSATVKIYQSTEENPTYVHDPSCSHMGDIQVKFSNASKGKNRDIEIYMYFGSTELFVTAMEEGTDNKASIKFDCLSLP